MNHIIKKAMIDSISAVIITKNAASTLTDTLNSLKSFSEIIIVDNGSTDETQNIAAQFENVCFHIDSFEGFGPTKNKAVALASNDWVLSIDADETLSEELCLTMKQWAADAPTNLYGSLLRENYFMGKAIHYGGWGNDKLIRLFNRKCFQFNNNKVHESVQVDKSAKEILLNGALRHNAVQNIGQFLIKVERYSELRQLDLLAKDKVPNLLFILLKVNFAFFRSYILQLGFLEGWRGMVIAYSNANGVFFKYMKAYSIKHK
jgi:glycosyltransferase involved in cell wall biosynthesis